MSPLRGSQGVALDLWDFTVLKAFMWPLALSQDWGFCPQPFICPSLKKGEGGLLTPTNDLRVPDTGCAKPQ